ncbi:MAG: hypothetical protein AUK44_03165 [Porphyromonadaceae bacterium CG2_30_38_12]|nr:MAG: hypothetical protein AUK44_03165 [Porphyromonadaceae bacterium CG2_30_38_12]
MTKIRVSIIFFLFAIGLQAYSQSVTVNAILDSTAIRIGSQATLKFEISQKSGQKVIAPNFSDSIPGGLEIVENLKTDTTKTDQGLLLISKKIVLTGFTDSLHYIPPFPFVVDGDTIWTKSLSLKVVQPFKIDTASNQIADIKPVMEPPFNWKGLLRILALILLVIDFGLLIFYIFKMFYRKKDKAEIKNLEPELPAHIIALAKLDRLKKEKSWQQNRTKQFHTELADVVREYCERTFLIPCLEMTSDEIISNLNHLRIENKTAYNALNQILRLADLVKFAKWDAMPDENELSLSNAYLFVNETKIEMIAEVKETDKK